MNGFEAFAEFATAHFYASGAAAAVAAWYCAVKVVEDFRDRRLLWGVVGLASVAVTGCLAVMVWGNVALFGA